MTEDSTPEQAEPIEPTEVELALIHQLSTLYELTFGITTSMLALNPPQVDGTNLQQRKHLENLQNCLNAMGNILHHMGSDAIKVDEGAKSSIILP